MGGQSECRDVYHGFNVKVLLCHVLVRLKKVVIGISDVSGL